MLAMPLGAAYLRVQADRCQRLSRMCMDLGTARDLRLMSEEYLAEAARMEQTARSRERDDAAAENEPQKQDQQSPVSGLAQSHRKRDRELH